MERAALDIYLRRMWRTRLSIAAGAMGLVLALVGADRAGWLLYDGGDVRRYDGRAVTVVHVVDGDTLEVRPVGQSGGPATRVRLRGVNAPEVPHPEFGRMRADPLGAEATDFTRAATLHQTVTLRLKRDHTRDHFGRLLAYVELPDGTVLNEALLASGLATADNRPDDPEFTHDHNERYGLLQQQAQKERLGLWK